MENNIKHNLIHKNFFENVRDRLPRKKFQIYYLVNHYFC